MSKYCCYVSEDQDYRFIGRETMPLKPVREDQFNNFRMVTTEYDNLKAGNLLVVPFPHPTVVNRVEYKVVVFIRYAELDYIPDLPPVLGTVDVKDYESELDKRIKVDRLMEQLNNRISTLPMYDLHNVLAEHFPDVKEIVDQLKELGGMM